MCIMTHYSRRASLRRSFGQVLLARKSVESARVDRLKGRNGFRAAVRLIREYYAWFLIEESAEDKLSDDVAFNVQMVRRQKVEKKALSLQDRSILMIRPSERTEAHTTHIHELFQKVRAFQKYSEELRQLLASRCLYQYVPAGRVIVREGRPAENLYFIVDGEVGLSRVETDKYTGEKKEIDVGTMRSGDTFGEVALLHSIPRSATVVANSAVDLLIIPRSDFCQLLKPTLMKELEVFRDALVNFDYFKGWDEVMIRECCVLSRVKDFKPDEVILGDGKGMVNFVHFVLDGECRVIEHILLRSYECERTGATKYRLYDPEEASSAPDLRRRFTRKANVNVTRLDNFEDKNIVKDTENTGEQPIDYAQLLLSASPSAKHVDVDRMSITTATLFDVINQWHAVTDVASMLMRESSVTSQRRYPDDIKTIFMNICTFQRGVCFGLGEEMRNRRIVAVTPVRCFLVPRYWLLERNRADIWGRVRVLLNSQYPSRKELFELYVSAQRWKKYKKSLVDDIYKRGRHIPTNTTVHDIPYPVRVREGIQTKI